LFQRSAYGASDIINNPLFSEVVLVEVVPTNSEIVSSNSGEREVDFKVSFNFNADDITYSSLAIQPTTPSPIIETPVTSSSDDSMDSQSIDGEDIDSNDTNL
jgi:hypothetical protein